MKPVSTLGTEISAASVNAPKPAQMLRVASGKKQKKKRTALLGVRVTDDELERWDELNVKTGQQRSAVLRKKLGIDNDVPNRRPALSKEATYDYHRAMIIRMSVDKVVLALQSISMLKDISEKEEAFKFIVPRVQLEVKKIKFELDALQLRSGICSVNPARDLLTQENGGKHDCDTSH